MKKVLLLLLLPMLLASCATDKLNDDQAKAVAEKLINLVSESKYEEANALYTVDFQNAEPLDSRKLKFDQLNTSLGKVKTIDLVELKNEQPTGEESRVVLTYSVKHEKVNTREMLVVVKDEGEYRVASHNVTSE